MFKSLFGWKKKSGKSVAQTRGRRPAKPVQTTDDAQARRIEALKAKNIRKAAISAAIDQVGPFQRPDIETLMAEARTAHKSKSPAEAKDLIHRALKLKGAAGIVDETFDHPARKYIALAIMRGLLEGQANPDEPLESGEKSPENQENPAK